jgi:hypothetical protein
MERYRLLALAFASTAFGGCAGLFHWGGEPASYGYARGQGQIVFQLPLAVVVEEVDRSLTEAGYQVTFRHVDRSGALVKATSSDGKTTEASLKVDGMLTTLSLKVGRWGDREKTETLIASVKKGVSKPKSDADSAPSTEEVVSKPKTLSPQKMKGPPKPRAEARKVESVDEPPN